MLPLLAMGALTVGSGAMSFMSGMGQKKSTAKQNRVQAWLDQQNDINNQARMADVNARREALGRELLTIEEKETIENNSWQRVTNTSNQTGGIDLAGFMAAGEKAGFNPVTWLNSGALSLFSTVNTVSSQLTENGGAITTTRSGHNAADAFKLMSPDMVTSQATQWQREPSMQEVIGNAGTAALSTAKDLYKMDQSQAFQQSLLDQQLAAIAGRAGVQTGRNPASGFSGTVGNAGGVTSGSGGLSLNLTGPKWNSDGNVMSGLPYPAKWELNDVKVTNPGFGWKVTPKWSDAQGWEDAYSDVGGNLYGAIKMINDLGLNVSGTPTFEGMSNLWNGKAWSGADGSATEKALRAELAKRGFTYWGQ